MTPFLGIVAGVVTSWVILIFLKQVQMWRSDAAALRDRRRRQSEIVKLRIVHLRCAVCDQIFEDGHLAVRVPGEPLVHASCVDKAQLEEMQIDQGGKRE